jgi:hypothetical protein
MHSASESQLDDVPFPDPGPMGLPNGKPHHRIQVACDTCHIRRVRCDMVSPLPCSQCVRKGINCAITRKQHKRGRRARSELANTNGTVRGYASLSYKEKRHSGSKHGPVSLPNMSPTSSTTPASTTEPCMTSANDIDSLLVSFMEDCRSATDASLQAGTGLDSTEGWSPSADLSDTIPKCNHRNNKSLSPLPDIWNPIDMATHTLSQGAPMKLCRHQQIARTIPMIQLHLHR